MNIKQKYTPFHRLLNLIISKSMLILFIKGFLRIYMMNKHHIVSIIESKTDLVPKETMTEIAKSIREPMWEWHFIFAHVMIFAFLARIIYMLLKGIRFPNPLKSKQPLKERLQGFVYIYFYVFVLISIVTGISIEKGFFPEIISNIETVHKWGIYWFPIFIVLHLLGVLLAEFSTKKGITSKMIGGD
jgi:cytochrome b561